MVSTVYERAQWAIMQNFLVIAHWCSTTKLTKGRMFSMGAHGIPRFVGLLLDCIGFCGGDSVDGRRVARS